MKQDYLRLSADIEKAKKGILILLAYNPARKQNKEVLRTHILRVLAGDTLLLNFSKKHGEKKDYANIFTSSRGTIEDALELLVGEKVLEEKWIKHANGDYAIYSITPPGEKAAQQLLQDEALVASLTPADRYRKGPERWL